MKRFVFIVLVAGALVVLSAGAMAANWWLWQADNHTGTSAATYVSKWTDNSHQFGPGNTVGDGWDLWWDNKNGAANPGWATVNGPGTASGRFLSSANFSASSNNPADPYNYWNIYNGMTVAWKMNLPAVDGASGNGNIRVSVQNASATGFTGQGTALGFDMYFGWDEYTDARYGPGDNTIGFGFWTPSGTRSGNWIKPTKNLAGVDVRFNLGISRYDDNDDNVHELYWDVWLDGVRQAADATAGGMWGADAQYHALIGAKWENGGTNVYFGERRTQGFNTQYALDYIGVTNKGVLPMWNGLVPEPSNLLALATGLAGLAGVMIRRKR